ncbi:type II toxin-antitoxin system PemK/MazF family toxin [Synechococcus sp. RSCCF101]|uniref:type II toxin-antitoxin system PemK/MazF family toxin n=1 Tax=Synechococcus sp. RSCCF101 TaxID=2511069 RepID=UPI0012464F7F|nr:type II toxin-antitoxin system PemK/MazF family toxin [Synechococcus sp. RSCCF101]
MKVIPNAGQIVVCDFGGYREPEIIKHRPVVVISPRPRKVTAWLCTVIPFSTTWRPAGPTNHLVVLSSPLPHPKYPATRMWALCDLPATVSVQDRLTNFSKRTTPGGRRVFQDVFVSKDDLNIIRAKVKAVLGIS